MWFDGVKKHNHANFPIIVEQGTWIFYPGCFNFSFNDTWLFELDLMLKESLYWTVKISHNTFKQDKTLWIQLMQEIELKKEVICMKKIE